MANLQALKGRIESIDKTASITKAMHRIAASKLVAAQQQYEQYHVFKEDFEKVIQDLVYHLPEHHYVKGHPNKGRHLYILISSDRGLAGGYHQQLFAEFLKTVKEHGIDAVDVFVIGKKGFYFAQKQAFHVINQTFVSNKDQLSIINYDTYVDMIEKKYQAGIYESIKVYYNHFVNTMKQEPRAVQLLPVTRNEFHVSEHDFLYEGQKEHVFDEVIFIYLQSSIYGAMVDAKLSEFSARIVAMNQATDNATEALETLRLKYNQARQQKITSDLLDITNGKDV